MKTYSVTFLPDEKTVQAAAGKSILEAAIVAGIPINSVCAGEGVCGKCRVLVKSGKVEAEPNGFLTRRDIQRGMALACHTYIHGDVVVEVPLESRISGVPQLASEDAIRFGRISERVGEGAAFAHDPLAAREYLELPEPSLTDNIADQERIYRELSRRREMPAMQMGLAILQKLPELLRESGWKVTALLGYRGGTTEVMEIEPGDTSARHLGIALDVGTTTVVAHLVDLRSSETLATKAKYNSQISLGDDVISRIMYSKNGRTAQAVARSDRQRHQRPDHRARHGRQGQVSRRRLYRLRRQHDDGPPAPGAQPGEHPPRTLRPLRDDAAGHPGRRDRGQDQPAGAASWSCPAFRATSAATWSPTSWSPA